MPIILLEACLDAIGFMFETVDPKQRSEVAEATKAFFECYQPEILDLIESEGK